MNNLRNFLKDNKRVIVTGKPDICKAEFTSFVSNKPLLEAVNFDAEYHSVDNLVLGDLEKLNNLSFLNIEDKLVATFKGSINELNSLLGKSSFVVYNLKFDVDSWLDFASQYRDSYGKIAIDERVYLFIKNNKNMISEEGRCTPKNWIIASNTIKKGNLNIEQFVGKSVNKEFLSYCNFLERMYEQNYK